MPDADTWAEGEIVTIRGVVRNVSTHGVRVFTMRKVWAIQEITLYDESGRELESFPTLSVSLRYPRADDFVDLRPGVQVSKTYTARLRRMTARDLTRVGRQVSGLFLDFGESVIVIPGPGAFQLEYRIDQDREAMDRLGSVFGFIDVWSGSAISPRVTVLLK